MFHGCPPSPDAWGRLTSEPRFIIYRETATFTARSVQGPLPHLVSFRGVLFEDVAYNIEELL
jgi:hypothetical protein